MREQMNTNTTNKTEDAFQVALQALKAAKNNKSRRRTILPSAEKAFFRKNKAI